MSTKIAFDSDQFVGASLVGARWVEVGKRLVSHCALTAETHFHTLGRRQQPAWVIPMKTARPAPIDLPAKAGIRGGVPAVGTVDVDDFPTQRQRPIIIT